MGRMCNREYAKVNPLEYRGGLEDLSPGWTRMNTDKGKLMWVHTFQAGSRQGVGELESFDEIRFHPRPSVVRLLLNGGGILVIFQMAQTWSRWFAADAT